MHKHQKQAFTLVELIIVVTILAILATISFMSFQGYTSKTRDSKRVTELKNIENGLQIYETQTGKYPTPDDKIIGSFSGTTLNKILQTGNVGTSVQQLIKMSELALDPITQEKYGYGISNNGKYYQISTILENELGYNPLIERAYATNSGYIMQVKGNYKGLYKDGKKMYNIPSLLVKSPTDVTIDANTKFIIKNQTNDGVDTQTALKEITGSGTVILKEVDTTDKEALKTLGFDENVVNEAMGINGVIAIIPPGNTTPVTPTKITIIGDETIGRKWSDNTYATSCNGYKNPTGNNEYSGNVGDGVYLIKPDSNTEFKVYCDMTTDGGGWTYILYAYNKVDSFTETVSHINSNYYLNQSIIKILIQNSSDMLFREDATNVLAKFIDNSKFLIIKNNVLNGYSFFYNTHGNSSLSTWLIGINGKTIPYAQQSGCNNYNQSRTQIFDSCGNSNGSHFRLLNGLTLNGYYTNRQVNFLGLR